MSRQWSRRYGTSRKLNMRQMGAVDSYRENIRAVYRIGTRVRALPENHDISPAFRGRKGTVVDNNYMGFMIAVQMDESPSDPPGKKLLQYVPMDSVLSVLEIINN